MIYADENVWMPVVEGVRRRGWDVTAAVEAETLGYTDEEHLHYAVDRKWTVLTFDDDFLSLVRTEYSDLEHSGSIFVPQHGRTVGELVRRIDTTLQQHRDRDLTNEIVYA